MPTLQFDEIECFDPRGSHDDVSLIAACDGAPGQTVWQQQMRAGNVVDLSTRTEGVVFYDLARVQLTGDLGHDFGSMTFDRHSDTGPGDFFFPGELNARYRVSFHLDALPAPRTHGQIRLIRLTCLDAQGTHDEVTLEVNSTMVLGPRHVMKTNWHVDFDEVPISFNTACTIVLRETYLQDWSESFTLTAEDPAGVHQHDFVASRRGLVGSAHYRLEYEKLA